MSDWQRLQGAREVIRFLGRSYGLMKPFWQSKHKTTAWTLILSLLAAAGIILFLAAKLSYATAHLFDALDMRQVDAIWPALTMWFVLLAFMLVLFVVQLHVRYHLIIHWRRFLTFEFLDDYLNANLYNQLELRDYKLDNADQRISMDLSNLAEESLQLGMELLSTAGRVVVFSVILWKVSGPLEFELAGIAFFIPGYMFWLAIVYAIVGTLLVHRLASPLTRLNFERQAVEADFRYQLLRLRENSESIATLGGEEHESDTLKQRFTAIWDNWLDLLKYKRRLLGFQYGIGQFSQIFPYIAAMPALLSGTIALGGFLQLRSAFGSVEYSLTWFITAYERLAVWKSSVDRVLTLLDAFDAARTERDDCRIEWRQSSRQRFVIKDLNIDLPSGQRLLDAVDLTFEPGQNIIVTGESGSGKSTFFKALSGQWVWGDGQIELPGADIVFVPQQSYLPIARLREVLTYPAPASRINDARIKHLMRLLRLEKYSDQLDEACDWSRVFSGGEQQRVSFVRAILRKPDWLFLDEATASLDPDAEAAVYSALQSELPDTTVISIAHGESLVKYHRVQIEIDPAARKLSSKELRPV